MPLRLRNHLLSDLSYLCSSISTMPPSRYPPRKHNNDSPRESLHKSTSKFVRRRPTDNTRSPNLLRDDLPLSASPSSSGAVGSGKSASPQELISGRQTYTDTSFTQASCRQTSHSDRMDSHSGGYSKYTNVGRNNWYGRPPRYSSVPHFDYSWSSTRNGYAHGYPALGGRGGRPLSYNQQVYDQRPLARNENQLPAYREQAKKEKTPRPSSRVPSLPVPVPTAEYMQKSEEPSQTLSAPKELLIILDLNGTLLCRKRNRGNSGSQNPHLRPGLALFLDYLFAGFQVLVWTSARPENARLMVDAAFTEEQRNRLLAIWGRDTLGLTAAQYNGAVQIYKKLEVVWDGGFHREDEPMCWDQTNTVLLDDSTTKALAQPYNHILVPEYLDTAEERANDTVLAQVMNYLEKLKWQSNVSSYTRQEPCRIYC